eukprot:CAMPEP_0170585994 /NCGR_PEP_ID=MMETSP0224-20130122/9511_1 /TAXON_ID=285029 /ORGANISM="Togula jolla, Strain CCCM 725" /LENGTH=234 /DNA_ID=CAMNT_0010909517 /DNA_START=171 /DNA_END=875 /DNA_ORIENTATION=+
MKQLSVASDETLAALDRNHQGKISISDVKRNVRQVRIVSRLTKALSVCVVVLILGMFGAVWAAVQLSKEIKVKDGLLGDKSGQAILTVERLPNMEASGSDTPADQRRLQVGYEGSVAIPYKEFKKMADKYVQGKQKDLVLVTLNQREHRTVKIRQASPVEEPRFANGVSGSICPGLMEWTLTCPEDSDMCSGTATLNSDGSTQALPRMLLDRAARTNSTKASSAPERSLEGKQC